MAARVARLEAEARGRSEVTFPDQLDQVVPAAVASETSVFKMRVQKVAQDVDVLNQQVNRPSRANSTNRKSCPKSKCFDLTGRPPK